MEIELSRLFVKVIQQGSFSKAAQQLQIPKSTLSKAVTKLEKETGTKLLLRTTRSLTLTAAGRAFYETCLGPVQVLEEAQRSLHGADDILSGVIRLTAPDDFGNFVLAKALTELLKKHPNLRFELKYTNETLDLVKEGIDLAIRVGKLKESSLKAKRIGENKLIFVASPAYLKSRNPIRAPKDLTEHECMTINAVEPAIQKRFRPRADPPKGDLQSNVEFSELGRGRSGHCDGADIRLQARTGIRKADPRSARVEQLRLDRVAGVTDVFEFLGKA